jgi:hypothetical protein
MLTLTLTVVALTLALALAGLCREASAWGREAKLARRTLAECRRAK